MAATREIREAKAARESRSEGKAIVHHAVDEAQRRGLRKREIFASFVGALGWAVHNGQLVAGEPEKANRPERVLEAV